MSIYSALIESIYSSSCRICLNSQNDMKSLVNSYNETVAYLEIFKSCTGLEIIEKSEIPSWICKECENTLLDFYKFRTKCIESDVLLTSIYITASANIIELKEEQIKEEDSIDIELDDIQTDDFMDEEICDDSPPTPMEDIPIVEETDMQIELPEIKIKKTPKKTAKKTRNCEICGDEVSAILTRYAIHVKSHNPDDPNPFQCKICNKKFKNIRCLRHHEQVHNNNKKSKCGYCPETFFHNSSKLLHERRIHTKIQPYKCSEGACDNRGFFSKSELNLHNKRHHTPIKPFECTVCLRKFSVIKDLELHSVIHTEVRHFQCDICGKQFSRETTLALHKKAHTIDLALPCKLCSLKFKKKHLLWKHIRENHQFDHTCEFCGIKFEKADNLRKHKTVHAIKKKYSCPVCPLKKFCKNFQLRRHIRDSHPGVEMPPRINPKERSRILNDDSIYYAEEDNEEDLMERDD